MHIPTIYLSHTPPYSDCTSGYISDHLAGHLSGHLVGFIPDCICRLRFRLHLQTTCSDHIPGFISDCIPTTFPTTISGYISDSKTHRKICTYSGATPKTLAHTPLSHIGLRLQALAVLPARELPEPLSQDGQRDLRVQASFSEFFYLCSSPGILAQSGFG